MKKDGCSELNGTRLGMEALHLHILGTAVEGNVANKMITLNSYLGAHRAFPDVQAMEAVMTHPLLVSCLTNLPIGSPKRQIEL